MIKLLLVSHSLDLAKATKNFCEKMLPENKAVKIVVVAGDDNNNFGNSLNKIAKELENTKNFSSTAIIYDLGSAKMILDLVLSKNKKSNVIVIDTPFVEGSLMAYAMLNEKISLEKSKKIIEEQIKK